MEKPITFRSQDNLLEGLLRADGENNGVVVTHPHPLFGGDMYNTVVETIVKAYQHKGYATLRFNFRGVEQSEGQFDNGVGEKNDVQAALKFMSATGIRRLDLAGYSFGAWVNAHLTSQDFPLQRTIMVSPPLGFIDFPVSCSITSLRLVITGSRDEIAPVADIQAKLPHWNQEAHFEVINGADHFYCGYLDQLEQVMLRYI